MRVLEAPNPVLKKSIGEINAAPDTLMWSSEPLSRRRESEH